MEDGNIQLVLGNGGIVERTDQSKDVVQTVNNALDFHKFLLYFPGNILSDHLVRKGDFGLTEGIVGLDFAEGVNEVLHLDHQVVCVGGEIRLIELDGSRQLVLDIQDFGHKVFVEIPLVVQPNEFLGASWVTVDNVVS